ncbi:MAG: right-handed parallel beta-helix repeat-containing protein [Thermoguttaceae bacterium]|nr:right-handed parallel beta-helix repeat-containing protein [Thermoguttaceae bacterium]
MKRFLTLGVFVLTAVLLAVSAVSMVSAADGVIPRDEKMIALAKAGKIERPKASFWGFNPTDSTDILQEAIDSGVKRLVVDHCGGPWIVRPMKLKSNQEVIFEEGVVLLAKRGEYHSSNAAVISIVQAENVTLRGEGKGATIRMWKKDYQSAEYTPAEWRHCILIRASYNVLVENMTLAESGGDGICIGGLKSSKDLPPKSEKLQSRKITLRKVICDANHRQGLSIGSVVDFLVEDCVFRNTSGTMPKSGVDFEPDMPIHYLKNCVMRNCLAENNDGDGFQFYLGNMSSEVEEPSFVLENCVARHNGRWGFWIGNRDSRGKILKGSMTVRNCLFDNNRHGIGIFSKATEGMNISFENTTLNVFTDGSREKSRADWNGTPIVLGNSSQDDVYFGNINFGNLIVNYGGDKPLLSYQDLSVVNCGLVNVSGDITFTQKGTTKMIKLDNAWCQEHYPASTDPKLDHINPLSLSLEPIAPSEYANHAGKGKWATIPVKNPQTYICSVQKGKKVEFTIRQYRFGIQPVRVVTLRVQAPSGRVTNFTIPAQRDVDFTYSWTAAESGVYTIIPSRGSNILGIEKSNVPIASSTWPALEPIRAPGTYYFYVPKEAKRFGIIIVGSDYSPVKVALTDPDGKTVWQEDSLNKKGSWFSPEGTPPRPGVWSVTTDRTKARRLEICTIAIVGIPALIAPAPEMLLKERP